MGSTESKNKNEEEEESSNSRLQFIKQVISTRNAFFAALASYAICLKNTGAALSDGTRADLSHHPSSVDSIPPTPTPDPPLSNPSPNPAVLPPVPPPTIAPKQFRWSRSMSELKPNPVVAVAVLTRKNQAATTLQGTDQDVVVEEEEENMMELPVPVRPMAKKRGGGKIGRKIRQPVSLKQMFVDIGDHFLKAFESPIELSQVLGATRLHYHSNFLKIELLVGHIDHKLSHLISWDHRTFKRMQDEEDGLSTVDIETLAAVLDKLLAWENKLSEEVNAGKVIKYDYERTVSLLNKQKKQGCNPKSLVKLNTSTSHLHTRYIVEMQSAVSTIAEINCKRDEQLYPSLVQLVEGMAKMWKTMLFHHESQAKIVYSLTSLENSKLLKETSEYYYECTMQLCGAVREWNTQFCGVIEYQKDFISALHNWSKLSVIPIESNLKEKLSSPPNVQNAPIHALVIAWKNDLDQLHDEVARNALRNFAAATQTIVHQQEEDLKRREKCKASPKELDPLKNFAKQERESVIVSLKQQLEEEEEACKKVCKAARLKSLASLRYNLLEVFSAMSEIAQACSRMYRNLRNIVDYQQASQNS